MIVASKASRDYETGAAVAVIGYARVGTTDQNPQLQLDARKRPQTLAKFGVPERERGEPDAIVESTRGDIVTSAAPAASQ
jgi:hypothetical protein